MNGAIVEHSIRRTILCAACFLTALILPAQGLILDNNNYLQQPIQSQYNDGSKSEEKALEGKTKVDLKAYCPEVVNQGRMGSCVGWSAGYGAYTIQQAMLNNWGGRQDLITDYAFSALFLFNQVRITDCLNGSRIEDALQLMVEQGELYSREFDRNGTNCDRLPTSEELEQAGNHRILDYMALFRPDDAPRVKEIKTKLSLVQHKPVVVGMDLIESFTQIRSGQKFWIPSAGRQGKYGGHAMVVIGYDDTLGAFEVMNSWGKDWGNQGFIWIKYEDFATYCMFAFQFSINEAIKKDKIYSGEFALRRAVAFLSNGDVRTQDEPVKFNGRNYVLTSSIEQGSVFQLLVQKVNEGLNLYVFSLDPEQKTTVLWPKDQALNLEFAGQHESPKITVPEVELFIPGADSYMQFNKKGDDYIVMLFATKPISNLPEQLELLKAAEGPIADRMQQVFGADLVASEATVYADDQMKFRNTASAGSIIPVVLQVKVQ